MGLGERISTSSSDLEQQRPLLLRANGHYPPSAQYGGHWHQTVHLVKKSQRNRILQTTLGASRNTWGGPFPRNQHGTSRVLEIAFWTDEISVRPEGILFPQKTKDPSQAGWRVITRPPLHRHWMMAAFMCPSSSRPARTCGQWLYYRVRLALHESILGVLGLIGFISLGVLVGWIFNKALFPEINPTVYAYLSIKWSLTNLYTYTHSPHTYMHTYQPDFILLNFWVIICLCFSLLTSIWKLVSIGILVLTARKTRSQIKWLFKDIMWLLYCIRHLFYCSDKKQFQGGRIYPRL